MSQLTQIHDKVWLVDVTLPEYSVRGAVIVGETYAVVWDTLSHPNDMADVLSIIGDKPYFVIYSHADWDHIWGTAGLSRQPEQIIGHKHCLERFYEDVPETLAKMQQEQPGQWGAVQLIPPALTFETGMNLDLGGLTLELHHVPGHTLDCIVGWLPELGMMLGGDVIETPLPVVNEESPLDDWLRRLQPWAENGTIKQTIPAHGTIEGRICLDSTVAYLEKLLSNSDFPTPDNLDDFYQRTHIKNLNIANS